MIRPYMRKAHPQHSAYGCPDCHGDGVTVEEEWDEDGPITTAVRCEGCAGQGELYNCDRCDGPLPGGSVAEQLGYVCANCRVDMELHDHEAERSRVRRTA